MSTGRELLMLAAKAAGLRFAENGDELPGFIAANSDDWRHGWCYWNPLVDDGAALRLSRLLGINVEFLPDAVRCKAPGTEWIGEVCLPCDTEYLGLVHRRAIVRCAAEIGKAMP